ncbi:DUF3147 family protein [Leptospira kanakyensis]|uniref:DUF3147 family protein n=1 Tax=Leptospira kanakyensis TaxID=2484968 RepID=UPI00223DA58B|nr:DUF3147 family protein [Leptospira kanakyensis]MCW7469762.1 DUF3147 family protein [Leptospira kanakyensis]MCW7480742.1 DUF3147 family protein [Leptospira kanakyensis]
MYFLFFKFIITAILIVVISEIAKRNDRMGALVGSLPLVTLLTLIWMYVENTSEEKIGNHSYYTFWYVLPTLPMFLIFPWLLKNFHFYLSVLFSILITFVLFYFLALFLKRYNIDLL